MNKAGKISTLVVGTMAVVGTLYATVKDARNRINSVVGIENSENVKNQTTEQTAEKLVFLKDEKGDITLEEEKPNTDGGDGKKENNETQTDLPAQIKAFVTQHRAFINKTKTTKNCINLYNVFATIEKDANTGLSADDISTRFNAAFGNDNPSGEALKHYITAYGLFNSAFKTDKVSFVNPNPETEEVEEFDFSEILEEKDKELEKLDNIIKEEDKKSAEKDVLNKALNYYISLVEKKDKSIAECIRLTKAKYPTVDIEAELKKTSKSN